MKKTNEELKNVNNNEELNAEMNEAKDATPEVKEEGKVKQFAKKAWNAVKTHGPEVAKTVAIGGGVLLVGYLAGKHAGRNDAESEAQLLLDAPVSDDVIDVEAFDVSEEFMIDDEPMGEVEI